MRIDDLPLRVLVVFVLGGLALVACSVRLRLSFVRSARHMRMAYETRDGYGYEPVLTTEQARNLMTSKRSGGILG